MKQVVELIIKSLVEQPDKVVLTESETTGDDGRINVTITVKVADGDMGRVIGKQGLTVNAIRTLLKNSNSKDGKRYFVQVGDKARDDRNGGHNDSSY
jgi:predicted RNA-binding protein YlqC (UPF0109 family)